MKKQITTIILLAGLTLNVLVLLTACATGGGAAEGLSLREAIEQSAEKIAGELSAGSRVAIVMFESESDNLSNYIMEELTGALLDRGIEVADRRNLEYVYQELNFQMSGDVSDESAQSIGKFLGAELVITGQLLHLGDTYRFMATVIRVEQATRVSVPRFDVRNDRAMQNMIAALNRQKSTAGTTNYGVSEDRTPQTAGTFIDRGIMFAMRGEYDMAIADFTDAIRLNPNLTAAYMLRTSALIASVFKVIEVGEKFSDITFSVRLPLSREQVRIFELVIADYTQMIRLNPNDAETYIMRGHAYMLMVDYDRAIADFEAALRIDPNDATTRQNLEQARQQRGY